MIAFNRILHGCLNTHPPKQTPGVSHRSPAQRFSIANRYCHNWRKLCSRSIIYFVIGSTIADKLGMITLPSSERIKNIQMEQSFSNR